MKKYLLSIAAVIFTLNLTAQIGVYDIQVALGANWMKPKEGLDLDGEFGTTYDIGLTVINLAHSKRGGSSSTVSIHYDYSRQNADASPVGSWHFRRNEIYARIKPFTNNPESSTYFGGGGSSYLLGYLLAGLYADVGYTQGTYYYQNYLDERQAPDFNQNGLVWGWGFNAIHRRDDSRFGMTAGYGAKIYNWTKANGTHAKYASRTIWLGVTYNFIWKND